MGAEGAGQGAGQGAASEVLLVCLTCRGAKQYMRRGAMSCVAHGRMRSKGVTRACTGVLENMSGAVDVCIYTY